MKLLNISKVIILMGVTSVVLTGCNMDDQRRDREERTVEKQTEVRKNDRNADGTLREERRTETTRRPGE